MDDLELRLTRGKDILAEIKAQAKQGCSSMSQDLDITLDSNPDQTIKLTGVPKRADPLQVMVDALHLLGYKYSGRQPVKAKAAKPPKVPVLGAE